MKAFVRCLINIKCNIMVFVCPSLFLNPSVEQNGLTMAKPTNIPRNVHVSIGHGEQ